MLIWNVGATNKGIKEIGTESCVREIPYEKLNKPHSPDEAGAST